VHFDDWYKKQVSLRWGNIRFELDVPQELFSSHEVDSGSLLLLRTLDTLQLGERGHCLDYGCGYGVLGLALKALRPEWEVVLVDRDALAVEFSNHNSARLDAPVTSLGGLDPLDPKSTGYDLLLWNVPGKAGASVLAELLVDSLDVLASEGLLALVVVHPLAETLREVAAKRADFTIELDERGPEHTLLHVRRVNGTPTPKPEAFERGVFDRETITVDRGDYSYGMTPVIGLPQYDGPDQPTLLMMDALASMAQSPITDIICIRPGVGHLPMAVASLWPAATFTLVDRDFLALKASSRALSERRGNGDRIVTEFSPDLSEVNVTGSAFDLVTVMLDHQTRAPVMNRLLDDLVRLSASGARLVFGGGSTEVSRMLAVARKRPELKIRDREKRKGFSAMVINSR
jgi:16S rRNA (guanine1207-N2)-methyltransferase